LSSDAGLGLFEAPDDKGIITQYLRGVATDDLVDGYFRAGQVVETALARQHGAAEAVAQTTTVLDADLATENQALTLLDADLQTMETAGACAGPSATPPAAPPAASTAPTTPAAPTTSTTTTSTTTTSTTSTSTTSTTTTVPAAPSPAGGAAAVTGPAPVTTLQGCLTAFVPVSASVSLSAAP
jgi:hypothetical protein